MKIFQKNRIPFLVLGLACTAMSAQASERESLEDLRQTTRGLIEALVGKGVLTREAADAMLQQSQARPPTPAPPQTAVSGKPVQRVPYVSEALKTQIRNEVKEEVLTQARAERWGVPQATAGWTERIKIDGDLSFRIQSDRGDADNTEAVVYANQARFINAFARAIDYASTDGFGNADTSTTASRMRERVRARLGITAKISEEVAVGLRLSTGSNMDRVSTNQTLGQNFNKYPLLVDRAFVRLTPIEGVDLALGRIPNPWFSTDLIWSDNLNFEGASMTARWVRPEASWEPFATVGAFPIRTDEAPTRSGRWLYGAQVGTSWQASARTRLKFGLAYYQYHNIEGRQDLDFLPNGAQGVTYGQYGYDDSLDQKGNTQFVTNAEYLNLGTTDGEASVFGLAYKFKPIAFTMASEFQHFSPYRLFTSFEYVRNTAFSRSDFLGRAGPLYEGTDPGGDPNGYHLRLGFGSAEVREQGDWLTTLSFKRLGSDAVLDAFTDSDMGLGGTNVQGFALGFQYGLYRNTTLGVRHLSSRSIDSPVDSELNPDAKFGVRTLQVDLNVRF